MQQERRQLIETLFLDALEQPHTARANWLRRHCEGDAELLAEVRALLEAHESADGILDAPLLAPAGRAEEPPAERRIGPYRVLRELGRGGMGVVYLAERDDGTYRRRVAIKLLRGSPDAEELQRRFRAERQILASLDHANIAQLVDGGVTDGQLPYLVMEYVDGVPITDYCDRHRLNVAARLRLFQHVCAAVHHAHRNLVLHRDLKPSNVLVTGTGQVKLLDFGIAKLLNPALGAEDVPVTRTAFRVMTPEYASPEQVRGDSLSTASDVYALGVVLYELLAGHRPYRLTSGSPREVAELVCEREPARPSSKVLQAPTDAIEESDTGALGPETIAAARDTSVERLRRTLQGDLDAIVMMALRKEPGRRYGSAEAMAEDVQRYLDGLPVQAQHASRWYRLQKLVRRHRVEVAAAALAATSLVAGAGAAWWQGGIAAQERDRATQAMRESQEVSDFLLGLFEASDPGEAAGVEITTRDLLRRGALHADELAGEPIVQARMLGVLGRVHRSLGDYEEAHRLSERALALLVAQHGEAHADVARMLAQLADVEQQRGRLDTAQALLARTLLVQARVHGAESAEHAETLDALAELESDRGNLVAAVARSREALELRRRVLGPDHALTLGNHVRLAAMLRQRGEPAAAEAALREALALRQGARGATPGELASDLVGLAAVLEHDSTRAAEAESLYQRAAALQHALERPDPEVTSSALYGLARLQEGRGDLASAEATQRDVVRLRGRVYGTEHPRTSAARQHLADFLGRHGRMAEAEAELRSAIEMDRRALGPTHPTVAGGLTALAVTLTEQKRLAEADSLLAEALRIREARLGPRHFLVAVTLRRRAQVQMQLGAYAAADSMLHRALAVMKAQATGQAVTVRRIHASLAELYLAWGRPAEAERFRRLAAAPGGAPARGAAPARLH